MTKSAKPKVFWTKEEEETVLDYVKELHIANNYVRLALPWHYIRDANVRLPENRRKVIYARAHIPLPLQARLSKLLDSLDANPVPRSSTRDPGNNIRYRRTPANPVLSSDAADKLKHQLNLPDDESDDASVIVSPTLNGITDNTEAHQQALDKPIVTPAVKVPERFKEAERRQREKIAQEEADSTWEAQEQQQQEAAETPNVMVGYGDDPEVIAATNRLAASVEGFLAVLIQKSMAKAMSRSIAGAFDNASANFERRTAEITSPTLPDSVNSEMSDEELEIATRPTRPVRPPAKQRVIIFGMRDSDKLALSFENYPYLEIALVQETKQLQQKLHKGVIVLQVIKFSSHIPPGIKQQISPGCYRIVSSGGASAVKHQLSVLNKLRESEIS